MYRIFTLLLLVLALGSAAGASNSVTTDRSWWEALDEGTQASVMMAAVGSYEAGYVEGYSRRAIPRFGKTMRAYMDGLNYFYPSHPEKTDMDFAYVLRCLADNADKTCDKVAADGY